MLTFTDQAKTELVTVMNMFQTYMRMVGPKDMTFTDFTEETIEFTSIYKALNTHMVTKQDIFGLRNLLQTALAKARAPELHKLMLAWEGMHSLQHRNMVTIEQAAAMKGIQVNSLRTKLSRLKIETIFFKNRAHLDRNAFAMI